MPSNLNFYSRYKVDLIEHKPVTVEYFVVKNILDTKKPWICFKPDLDWIVLAVKAFYKT